MPFWLIIIKQTETKAKILTQIILVCLSIVTITKSGLVSTCYVFVVPGVKVLIMFFVNHFNTVILALKLTSVGVGLWVQSWSGKSTAEPSSPACRVKQRSQLLVNRLCCLKVIVFSSLFKWHFALLFNKYSNLITFLRNELTVNKFLKDKWVVFFIFTYSKHWHITCQAGCIQIKRSIYLCVLSVQAYEGCTHFLFNHFRAYF